MSGSNTPSRADRRARAQGYVGWNVDPYMGLNAAALSNQEVQAVGLWLPFGVPISNILLNVTTAGVGTVPTGFFVGIGNSTKMLRQSINLNNAGSLQATGLAKYALTAAYTPTPTDSPTGWFYITILQNAAFGTTNVQFARTGGIQVPVAGAKITAGRAGTAQTALPANGATYSTALAAAGGQNWVVAAMP